MKNITFIVSMLFIMFSSQTMNAQIWKKITKKAEERIEKKAEEKMDDVLNGKKKKTKKQKRKETKETEEEPKRPDTTNDSAKNTVKHNKPEIWRNYKFIPGEKVIFFDDLKYEEVGEFPSRWDLAKGGAEVALFNGEKVIITTNEYYNRITPLFDVKNYLSNEFTIEFDIYVEGSNASNFWTEIIISLQEDGLENYAASDIDLKLSNGEKTTGHAIETRFNLEEVSLGEMNAWHHMAFSYYNGKFKMYYDEKRIANLPKIKLKPELFAFGFRGYASGKNNTLNVAVKNVRIAHGGGQMYKRIMADGKYTTNGILFDSGKANIKPQSMGILNKLVTVMKENPDWKFQIIGHTDNDGDTKTNLDLSQDRAKAVKQALVALGIKANRFTTLGKGENEPLNGNTSPEEKANNRRVEFVKK